MIASTIVRASENGLPALPVRVGSIGAINSHWASESIWKRDMPPGSQLTRGSILRHALVPAEDLDVGPTNPDMDREQPGERSLGKIVIGVLVTLVVLIVLLFILGRLFS